MTDERHASRDEQEAPHPTPAALWKEFFDAEGHINVYERSPVELQAGLYRVYFMGLRDATHSGVAPSLCRNVVDDKATQTCRFWCGMNYCTPSETQASDLVDALRARCPGNGDDADPVECQAFEASEGGPCPPGCCVMAEEKDVRAVLAAIEDEDGAAPAAPAREAVNIPEGSIQGQSKDREPAGAATVLVPRELAERILRILTLLDFPGTAHALNAAIAAADANLAAAPQFVRGTVNAEDRVQRDPVPKAAR